ncbi:MAG TPA: xanthine dehydrogenase family protein subunit M [Syntrophorhabdaceae bacterium]|jgi:carbon-monoxide dehydrogenase medium subunit|nr:xanthine dehydrogenase family protein subunit M [Syntrophorhabdaceae bacterium]MDI9561287.1 xanthine dehydrogenase family protein subunit M [Pseudomonadota bacterium]OQC48781.1 MAG: Carbon monoxide dehydrogenase medium chain [Deltaproteobacteria bacterium ADurb.Bin026]MBP8698032.1 xanthine dehydrogenase family protein subunit M [Syntrophorhabdaceae bacterium]MBV6506805.1 Carbon monoxide dehydrogenase medium chain [Syntrophorhabdaceae bacterium]
MLLLPKFDYYEPREMSEALKLMSKMKTSAKIIAGGTDVLVNMKKGLISPKSLVNVARISELSDVEPSNGTISIGSGLIVEKLTEFDIIKKKLPILFKAARVLGSPLVRNRATIGGNIVTARPAADLPPALLAVDAKLKLVGAKSSREVSLDKFFIGPGQTVIKPTEILSRIIIKELPPFTGGDYIKLGHRNALEIAIVAVASRITLDSPDGVIKEARIILSAVAPKAIHAVSAEKALKGEKPTAKLFEKVAKLAAGDCAPITDIRGGAEYRRAMVAALTKKTLMNALNEAKGK